MNWQEILVVIVVALAAAAVARRFWQNFKGKGCGCGDSCDCSAGTGGNSGPCGGCAHSGQCGAIFPEPGQRRS